MKRRPTKSSYRKVAETLIPFDREAIEGKYSKGRQPKKKNKKKPRNEQ